MSDFKNEDGTEAAVKLRKVPLKDLGLLAGDLSDEQKAALCIAPEGRNPEEVRAVFDLLDEESQFEVWEQGLALNEDNLERYTARKKKLAEASGFDVEAMVQKMVQSKMEAEMEKAMAAKESELEAPSTGSPASLRTVTDGGT